MPEMIGNYSDIGDVVAGLSDADIAGTVAPDPGLDEAGPGEAEASPEVEGQDATEEAAPESQEGIRVQDDGSLKLPDGRVITQEQLEAWAGGDGETEPAKPAGKSPEIQALEAQIAELKGILQPAAKQPDPRGEFISALTEEREWLQARQRQYVEAGQQPTRDQLMTDLALAQNRELAKQLQESRKSQDDYRQQLEVQRHEKEIERELDVLVGKYPNVQGEIGGQVLEMALALAAQKGETDLEKVVRDAHEMVPKLVMQVYGQKKIANIQKVKGNMPRGGGNRKPPPKNYGKDFGAISRMAADIAKQGE